MARSRDISKVLSSNTTLATDTEVAASYLTLTSASTTYAPVAAGGLVLINSTSFSAQSSVNINNVFSSTYDSYKIIVESSGLNNGDVFLRFRSGTTDLSSGYYGGGLSYQTNGTFTSSGARSNGTEIMIQEDMHGSVGANGFSSFDVYGMSSSTGGTHQVVGFSQSSYTGVGRSFAYMTTNGGTRDGFVIFVPTNNMTGKVTTYGYKK
jgi:hypothetical protein